MQVLPDKVLKFALVHEVHSLLLGPVHPEHVESHSYFLYILTLTLQLGGVVIIAGRTYTNCT